MWHCAGLEVRQWEKADAIQVGLSSFTVAKTAAVTVLTAAPAFQATGHLVGAVTEFINRLLDAPGNGIGEQGAVIADEARDAGLGHASAFGDVKHGHAAALGGGEVVHGLKPCYWIYRLNV